MHDEIIGRVYCGGPCVVPEKNTRLTIIEAEYIESAKNIFREGVGPAQLIVFIEFMRRFCLLSSLKPPFLTS